MRANGNTAHPCASCGQYALITCPVRVRVGKRNVDATYCLRCYLRRQEGE